MTESSAPTFRTTMRGYDPAAVDQYIAQLTQALAAAQQQSAELGGRVNDLAAAVEQARMQAETPPAAPTFADLGARVGQILTLAEEEANDIRSTAAAEIKNKLAELEAANAKTRGDADRYANEARVAADREAARILEDAKRSADQLLDDADRQATARREEAEAIHERQRALAAKAAADFEQTLAERRSKAEKDFQERTALAEQQLVTAQQQVTQLRAEAEQALSDANRKAARITAESESKAEQTISEAMARADRIRAESERELVAATQRRDAINAQLTNVRQMLATLSGTTPANIQLPGEDTPAEPAADGENA